MYRTYQNEMYPLFNLPVLFLMLLQEDLFLFLNLSTKLLLRRKKQLILAREYGFVVRRQGETHRRVVLLRAEQYANGRILVRLLLVAVVVVDIELKLPKVLMRQLVIFYLSPRTNVTGGCRTQGRRNTRHPPLEASSVWRQRRILSPSPEGNRRYAR